jgi:hypothetical protein
MATDQLFKGDLPAIGVSALRASKAITADSTSVKISFADNIEREVGVSHHVFPKGGGWSFFLCPTCGHRVRTLKLYDSRVVCWHCDGLRYRCQSRDDNAGRIERLRQALYGPKPVRYKRRRLEIALRRALLVERRKWLT